jgi:hypothetical protein
LLASKANLQQLMLLLSEWSHTRKQQVLGLVLRWLLLVLPSECSRKHQVLTMALSRLAKLSSKASSHIPLRSKSKGSSLIFLVSNCLVGNCLLLEQSGVG